MRLRQSLWKQELHMLMRRVEWDSQSELWLHQIMSTRTHVHALQGRTQQLCDVCLSARAGTAGRGEKHAFAIIAVIISWIYTIYTRFDNWGVSSWLHKTHEQVNNTDFGPQRRSLTFVIASINHGRLGGERKSSKKRQKGGRFGASNVKMNSLILLHWNLTQQEDLFSPASFLWYSPPIRPQIHVASLSPVLFLLASPL